MLNFIVLGIIPGTQTRINFHELQLALVTVLIIGIAIYAAFGYNKKRSDKQAYAAESNFFNLISI